MIQNPFASFVQETPTPPNNNNNNNNNNNIVHSTASAPSSATASTATTTTTNTKTVTSEESGLSQNISIRTLEEQYVEPIGQRLYLFVRTNNKCCLEGGVETLLKKMKTIRSNNNINSTDMNNAGITTPPTTQQQQQQQLQQQAQQQKQDAASTGTDSSSGGKNALLLGNPFVDPFSFLNEPSTPAEEQIATANNNTNSMAKFFKKVAKTTTQSLERKMQELAIRTDPEGRKPDLYTIAIYQNDYQLISATESVVPTEATPSRFYENNNRSETVVGTKYLSFVIPLVIPPYVLETAKNNPNVDITIKLWIKSQAFFKKQYLLGWVSLNIAQLQQALYNSTSYYHNLSLPLYSPYLDNNNNTGEQPSLNVLVTRDLKFTATKRFGWSLTDPDVTGYKSKLFNLPLDQPYQLPLTRQPLSSPTTTTPTSFHQQQIQPSYTIGVERATESSIVLPVATAMANLYADAARISSNHAVHVAQNLLSNRHDAPTSTQPLSATCVMSVGMLHFDPNQEFSKGNSTSNILIPNNNEDLPPTITAANVSISWQPPDCLFEVELLSATTIPVEQQPTPPMTMNTVPQFTPVKSFNFYPRVCTAGILPTILGAYGGKLPQCGYCIGNLRIQVTLRRTRRFSYNYPNKSDNNINNTGQASNNNNMNTSVQELVNAGGNGTNDDVLFAATNSSNANQSINNTSVYNNNNSNNNNDSMELWESILVLENLVDRHKNYGGRIPVALYHSNSGVKMGTLYMDLRLEVTKKPTTSIHPLVSPKKGLVSLMGLDVIPSSTSLAEHNIVVDGCIPPLDNAECTGLSDERRQRQMETLGAFVSYAYLDQHVNNIRSKDTEVFFERAYQYKRALASTTYTKGGDINNTNTDSNNSKLNILEYEPPSHENKFPRPFRPSSSRSEDLLSSIPFNVHNASFSIDSYKSTTINTQQIQQQQQQQQQQQYNALGAVFSNITCGAPADHAKGFGNVFAEQYSKGSSIPILNVSGGLRRLEAKRAELAQQIYISQTNLITGVSNFFAAVRMEGKKYVNHVPGRHAEIQALRFKVFETVQAYHHLTWHCAVRRANTFSQALCIAISSYLSSLSNSTVCNNGLPELWAKHGFLVSFEGLLSAAGKELGMIEDASVAIEMLRGVQVVLLPSDYSSGDAAAGTESRVKIPHSSFLKWIKITENNDAVNNNNNNNNTVQVGVTRPTANFLVQIGIHRDYYYSNLPECLKNGAPVSLYPLLFQVGVDIRQWGAHAGSNMKNQFAAGGPMNAPPTSSLRESNNSINNNNNNNSNENNAGEESGTDNVGNMCGTSGGLLDDDDDDVGIPDDDVLVALNYEAFQKMNVYAYKISPISNSNQMQQLQEQQQQLQQLQQQQQLQQVAHPSLAMLQGHIVTSAGKMNHSILDEAATIAQQLGGGGVVFCKSGKDRTAMHVTYKMAQFFNRYMQDKRQQVLLEQQLWQNKSQQPQQQQQQQQGYNTNKTNLLGDDATASTNSMNSSNSAVSASSAVPVNDIPDNTLEDATTMRVYGTRLPICEKNVGQALYAFNSLQVKFMPEALKPPQSTLAGFLKGGRVFSGQAIES